MKHLTYLLIFPLFIHLSSFGQTNKKHFPNQKPIQADKIDFIDMCSSKIQSDTILSNRKRLTKDQGEYFAQKWTNGKLKGPYKFIPVYFITIYFKDGSKREFRTNSTNLIKEETDWAYEIGDIKFVDTLWGNANIHPINSIKTIFDNYIEYNESTDSKGNKYLMTSSLENLTIITEPSDYELLLNIWMYYSPTDSPTLYLIPELLKKNKPESIEAVKKRIQNKKEWENENTAPYKDLYKLLQQLQE
ncbi:hypothetical protein CHU_1300 [Cytophaga hutchinsonii ATCC 33406]|uniref:Uncharacterized protein n=1 Tax=Cytophaga hutchinsonii (strain ATCC 33406 / DSM 1761 / CIP 103989 / NBRC 15051 / NCIMB 9469 / D465) TaxID=269798 RepID=A0A6N4SQF9_CYTH3|nr:hypothetical protein CHU_1300 [Cytophaga hutchinsonii ATCC 33406]SFX77331.1 hypothetical protein SAMN04487930_109139 [Cytophaga hutchinsonii ATCC 33406]